MRQQYNQDKQRYELLSAAQYADLDDSNISLKNELLHKGTLDFERKLYEMETKCLEVEQERNLAQDRLDSLHFTHRMDLQVIADPLNHRFKSTEELLARLQNTINQLKAFDFQCAAQLHERNNLLWKGQVGLDRDELIKLYNSSTAEFNDLYEKI